MGELYLQKINDLISEKKVAKKDLAELLGKNRNTIKNYLEGHTPITVPDLYKIAEYCEVPVITFFLDEKINLQEIKNLSEKISYQKQIIDSKDDVIKSQQETINYLKKLYENFSQG